MNICECGVERLNDIYQIERQAVERYDEIIPGFMRDILTREGLWQMVAEGIRYFCAFEDDRAIGFIGYEKIDITALVRGLFILPGHQRRGIGSALLTHFESHAKTDNARRILLLTLSEADWAMSFYGKHGFREIIKGKDGTIRRFWKPLPESIRVRYPDVPMSLLKKEL